MAADAGRRRLGAVWFGSAPTRAPLPRAGSADRYRDQAPDAGQLLAATLLIGLVTLPLLRWLDLQVGLFVVVLLGLRLATLRWPALQPRALVLFALTVLALVNVVDAYRAVAGQDAGTALLLSMLTLKLLEARTRRDLRVLTMVVVFLLVILFLFDEALGLTIYLLLLLAANVALMADLNVGAATAGRANAGLGAGFGAGFRAGPRLHQAAHTALVLTMQAAPLALLLFLLFPRLDAPLWDLGLGGSRAKTGLKNWLEPGSVGELVISGEDAFRARFDQPPGIPAEAMYWRGPVLWQTDGRRWLPLPGPNTASLLAEKPRVGGGQASVVPLSAPIDYTVVLDPTDQRWLFALDLPLAIPADATMTVDYQVLAERPVSEWRLYRMTSVLRYQTTAADDGAGLDARSDAGLDPYLATLALQLPGNVTARMRELVAGWQRADADPRAVVEQAIRFFNAPPFRYTLLPPPLGANPADAFLFETQSGFCEHYASSFVLLMRLAGIPSRIVLGYLGGDYNPLSNDYLVRQSDAHAWAEVWLADAGWVRVDPTAAVPPERVDPDARLSGLGASAPVRFRVDGDSGLGRLLYQVRMVAGAIDSGWKHWIIGFSTVKQRRLLDELGLGPLREYGLVLLLVVTGSTVMLILTLALARARPQRDAAAACFERVCQRLARIGLPRADSEGPRDYGERVSAARPDLAAGLTAILAPYLALHYRDDPDPARLAELRRQVRGFRPRRRIAPPGFSRP